MSLSPDYYYFNGEHQNAWLLGLPLHGGDLIPDAHLTPVFDAIRASAPVTDPLEVLLITGPTASQRKARLRHLCVERNCLSYCTT